MKKIKVMTVFGTRPEAIKMAPVIKEIERNSDVFEPIVTVTGQHREMLDQVLELFGIKADYDLNIMKERQTLVEVTKNVLGELDEVFKNNKPNIVLVHGDTTTSFAASLAAFYNHITIGHIEAGLRTYNKYSPFPEEMNRGMTSVLADLHFAPTIEARQNLLNENINQNNIFVTGNTVIDSLKITVKNAYTHNLLAAEGRLILLTVHRRENIGQPIKNVFNAIKRLVEDFQDIYVIYPVHLNPEIRKLAEEALKNCPRVYLIDPIDAFDFHNLMAKSYVILTDSGGVQEEAPSLGVPVIVLRDTTERPEGLNAGTLRLVGTNENKIYEEVKQLLVNGELYNDISTAVNPYGDGKASERIVDVIKYHYGLRENKPSEFTLY
ncbi:UDP-N-acetylglucosamine 2-epimerase [Bacillus sp. LL01]|uniref:non-hydrolyzing UDP-N-acetylglucosamine 2-epimerase n=1 Tax=Bacillus sp. LL01 TaxID=1665556 RepID=UPI00064D1922|nr:UDP-N-acetylglucosamine 2-epimerase (non-hydrolyzing) [Bacillus sp. LL01]KMJ59034.1 UDP-N-acetylglucosamine 2-epimerase [Bacillus sp. LL01]